jgi:hypothetical protein
MFGDLDSWSFPMADESPSASKPTTSETETRLAPSSSRPSWLWFAAGFLVLFVGMSIFFTRLSMHPSREAVIQYQLWQYYLVEIPRSFEVRNLGPRIDAPSPFVVLIQHVAASAVGGALIFGIVWAIRKLIAKK